MVWNVLLKKKKHPLVNRIYKVLLDKGFEGTFINKVYQEGHTLHLNIHLPEGKERSNLDSILPNLQQEVAATAVKYGKVNGKYFEILFGMRELEDTPFSTLLLNEGTLKVVFPSAYGEVWLDFEDGASCHLLNGGTTRMGKTCFLLYIATSIFLQNNGEVDLYISSAKLKDYYPFLGIPNVRMEKDIAGMSRMLNDIIDEYKVRDELLYSPSLRKATDAKSVRKLYPEHYHLFKPIFLIIDEYARFAESKDIQDMVTEIVETAGFVNVHVIIASQRPDASTVLKSRIRANLLARMAFTTADKKNSEIILDREGAEKLGKIAGRGLFLDSDMHTIQVPYIEAVECDQLLEPYRREDVMYEQENEGYDNHSEPSEIQSVEPQPTGTLSLQGEQQSSECSEPSFEASMYGGEDITNTKGKR